MSVIEQDRLLRGKENIRSKSSDHNVFRQLGRAGGVGTDTTTDTIRLTSTGKIKKTSEPEDFNLQDGEQIVHTTSRITDIIRFLADRPDRHVLKGTTAPKGTGNTIPIMPLLRKGDPVLCTLLQGG